MTGSTQFVVGNTYTKLPPYKATTSRTGVKKVHDVTVYVDFLDDDGPSIIDRVSFDCGETFSPQVYVHSSPVPVTYPNGKRVWRFSTRQQVFGTFQTTIKIRGTGGTSLSTEHTVEFEDTSRKPSTFTESRGVTTVRRPVMLPPDATFGIELEMSTATYMPPDDIARKLHGSGIPVYNIDTWSEGRHTSPDGSWKLVPDSSIVCSTTLPDCNRFELVSPILRSGNGLSQTSSVLNKLKQHVDMIKINKSMGYHVHIDVSRYTHDQLVKICQQFVKYEAAMDTLLPMSRRTSSNESNEYFRSNRDAVLKYASINNSGGGGRSSSIWDVHNTIANCQNIHDLVRVMNPEGRYYKLNLTNLSSGRQPTLEFRQHSSTTSYEKVGSWIRFCYWFCEHSAKLVPPKPFRRDRTTQYQTDALFTYVIKDRALRDFYMKRQQEVLHNHDTEDEGHCGCNECVIGRIPNCQQEVLHNHDAEHKGDCGCNECVIGRIPNYDLWSIVHGDFFDEDVVGRDDNECVVGRNDRNKKRKR